MHLRHAHSAAHDRESADHTQVTAALISAQFDADSWRIDSAFDTRRDVTDGAGGIHLLHDAVLRTMRIN